MKNLIFKSIVAFSIAVVASIGINSSLDAAPQKKKDYGLLSKNIKEIRDNGLSEDAAVILAPYLCKKHGHWWRKNTCKLCGSVRAKGIE